MFKLIENVRHAHHIAGLHKRSVIKDPDLWNSEDSGCKQINEMYKIKWFDGSFILKLVGGQIDKQITVD